MRPPSPTSSASFFVRARAAALGVCAVAAVLSVAGCGQKIDLPTPPQSPPNPTNSFIWDAAWSGYPEVTDLLYTRHHFAPRLVVVSDSSAIAAYFPGAGAGLPSLAVATDIAFDPTQLLRPVQVAEGADGSFYVADMWEGPRTARVTHFSADGASVLGVYRDRRDANDSTLIEWRTMEGITVDGAGDVFVAGLVDSIYRNPSGVSVDTTHDLPQIRRYSADGGTVTIWAQPGSAASPSAAGHPAGIFYDGSGLLVADRGSPEVPSRILKLSISEPQARYPVFGTDKEGFIRSIASPDPIEFVDVTADAEGYIYATDPATHRVLRFDPAGTQLLHLVNRLDQVPSGQTAPDAPTPVAAWIGRDTRSGLATMRVFTSDPPTNRIIRYVFSP